MQGSAPATGRSSLCRRGAHIAVCTARGSVHHIQLCQRELKRRRELLDLAPQRPGRQGVELVEQRRDQHRVDCQRGYLHCKDEGPAAREEAARHWHPAFPKC